MAGCQFGLQDGAAKRLTGTLNNYGTLSLDLLSQIQMDSGCVINNAGLCETWAEDPFGHANNGIPTFNNTGTSRKLGDFSEVRREFAKGAIREFMPAGERSLIIPPS